ncbi:response regulator transcription factor [Sulfurovum sp. bin170]|uniref:response regulator transcription factor n=1 Tax=Sulfurovum sp. bin170 TaxID=2695268 RepID=UPI0013DF4123|nr:DNA-binding response regulator [Sulfurovum sp. bin170]NEW60533.1 response regulator transcription factor [Sulfurovum sp. bin170]
MQNYKKKILVVEDESICAEYLQTILAKEYTVVGVVDNGKDAIIEAMLLKPDLILMDIMLIGRMSGCEAAVQIHQQDRDIKIIFLTAYADEEMIDYAIESEATAYLMKPYIKEEILATIKLLFAHNDPTLTIGEESIELGNGYIFNIKRHRLLKENQEIHLGKKTLKLVEILVKNINISVSNEQICTYVWGEPKNDRTLRSLIYRIRHMVGCNMIENVNGLGYKIVS